MCSLYYKIIWKMLRLCSWEMVELNHAILFQPWMTWSNIHYSTGPYAYSAQHRWCEHSWAIIQKNKWENPVREERKGQERKVDVSVCSLPTGLLWAVVWAGCEQDEAVKKLPTWDPCYGTATKHVEGWVALLLAVWLPFQPFCLSHWASTGKQGSWARNFF